MNPIAAAAALVERLPLPDAVTSAGARYLIARTSRRLAADQTALDPAFARAMATRPIAVRADAANAQHYELPPPFFDLILGPQRKYSSCYYEAPTSTLAEAEECALETTAKRAQLSDGQSILELGCGWGSLTLWMARAFPAAHIQAVSNSQAQRRHILAKAQALGLTNVEVMTADMNVFAPPATYDRIVSVEMFEHMSNWRSLLTRAASWLKTDGKIFLHVFSHKSRSYAFDENDKADWMAQHFFTGGVMPSHHLIREFSDVVAVESEWRWNGTHYARTLLDWLALFDARRDEVDRIFASVYGRDSALWGRRWRLFLIGSAELFGFADGEEWGVSHYLLRPAEKTARS